MARTKKRKGLTKSKGRSKVGKSRAKVRKSATRTGKATKRKGAIMGGGSRKRYPGARGVKTRKR